MYYIQNIDGYTRETPLSEFTDKCKRRLRKHLNFLIRHHDGVDYFEPFDFVIKRLKTVKRLFKDPIFSERHAAYEIPDNVYKGMPSVDGFALVTITLISGDDLKSDADHFNKYGYSRLKKLFNALGEEYELGAHKVGEAAKLCVDAKPGTRDGFFTCFLVARGSIIMDEMMAILSDSFGVDYPNYIS